MVLPVPKQDAVYYVVKSWALRRQLVPTWPSQSLYPRPSLLPGISAAGEQETSEVFSKPRLVPAATMAV